MDLTEGGGRQLAERRWVAEVGPQRVATFREVLRQIGS
jgi:hypothetical protein